MDAENNQSNTKSTDSNTNQQEKQEGINQQEGINNNAEDNMNGGNSINQINNIQPQNNVNPIGENDGQNPAVNIMGNIQIDMDAEGDGDWESDNEIVFDIDVEVEDENVGEDLNSEEQIIQSEVSKKQQEEQQISKFDAQKLPPQVKVIWDNITKLQPLQEYIPIPQSKQVGKQVCAKIFKGKETIVQCFDCRMDQSCIVCMDCFKNGNHQGHKYIVKKSMGGCCDCGDPQAWKEKGFCKNHSGKFKDFEIPSKEIQIFSNLLYGLFYIYFDLALSKFTIENNNFTMKLIDYLNDMNEDNTYINKLTAICITRKLPPKYSLNPKLDERTILENILTTEISGKYFQKWFELFITMFSYYPFKLDILKHYIKNYRLVIDGTTHSIDNAFIISSQLITSYKVVEQYCKENSTGIGQGFSPPSSTDKIIKYYQVYTHDLNALCNLAEEASFWYWKMHISNQQSIKSILNYYYILMKKAKSYLPKKTQTEITVKYLQFIEIQLKIVQIFAQVVKIIAPQPHLLQKIINILWNQCSKYWQQNTDLLCILRPLERCLTIALFSYFECSLEYIQHKRLRLVNEVLKIDEESLRAGCCSILKRMMKSLFYYSKCQAEHGLAQTLYLYLIIYKTQSKLLFMADLLSVKMFLLLCDAKYPLMFQQAIEMKSNPSTQSDFQEKLNYLVNVLKMVRYFSLNFVPEIYISYAINPTNIIYNKELKYLVLNFFKEKDNSVPQTELKTNLIENILPSSCKAIDIWVKQNCHYNKQKKSYHLEGTLKDEMNLMKGLNYDDFWMKASSKDPFGDIEKSIVFVKNYNVKILSLLWNENTLDSLEKCIHLLSKGSKDNSNIKQILPLLSTVQIVKNTHKLQSCEKITKILKEFADKIPSSTLKLLHFQIKNDEGEATDDRRQRMKELKNKKLQKFKQKQQLFIQSQLQKVEQSEQQKMADELDKIELEGEVEHCCCICRKQQNQNSVIIVNLSVRNHEQLLKLGSGMQCISLNTCKHVFDLQCIEKLYKKGNNINNITCPLCKYVGNMLFPSSPQYSQHLSKLVAEQVFQILSLISQHHNFYQEIVKAFYHYFILCSIDLQTTVQKKGSLYRTLLQMTNTNITVKQIERSQQRFENKEVSRYFEKELQQEKGAVFNNFQMIANFLNNMGQTEQFQEIQNQLESFLSKKQPIELPKNYQRKQFKESEKKSKQQYSQLFVKTFKQIIRYLKGNKNEEPEELIQKQPIQIWLSSLIDPKFKATENVLHEKKYSLFRSLPQTYTQISNHKRCAQCQQMSAELIMCLLCDWQGCQKCDRGYAKVHINEKHGEVGAVMKVQKGLGYYVVGDKSTLAGYLYEDEKGSNLEKSTNWQQFELNSKLVHEMERRLILDDIPTRSKKIY